jgi:hypothetical protein
MDAVPVGPDGFLQGLIRLNYSLINYIKTILSFIMKGYREIIAVVVFEFAKGGVPKRKASGTARPGNQTGDGPKVWPAFLPLAGYYVLG